MRRNGTGLLWLLLIPWLAACTLGGRSRPTGPAPAWTPQGVPGPTATAQPVGEGRIEPLADGGVRLSTADGLTLTLDAAGRVAALQIEGQDLPIAPAWPLLVRDLTHAAEAGPNLLPNPGFEQGLTDWAPYAVQGAQVEVHEAQAHGGRAALAIRGEEGSQGAVIGPPIPVKPGQRYRVSAFFQADFGYVLDDGNPTFWQDAVYRGERPVTGLYLQWLDAQGEPLTPFPQLAVPLHWSAPAWRRLTREVVAPADAAAVRVIVGARPAQGAVWVDDVGFVAAPETEQPLQGPLTTTEDGVLQQGQVGDLHVRVTYRPYGDHLAITVEVKGADEAPRALDVAWGVPLASEVQQGAWRWWDGLRERRVLQGQETFARVVSADVTGYLPISLYPYSVLENGQVALSLALALDAPRFVLLRYDGWSGRYEGLAHLGLGPGHPQADYTLLLYRSDPAWGLRAAAAKHAAIGPKWYASPLDLTRYTDTTREHFSASGPGADRLRALNAEGVFAAQYTAFEWPVPVAAADQPRPDYASAAQAARQAHPERWATLACDSSGQPHLKRLDVFPWSERRWTAIWIPNMSPDLPGGQGPAQLAALADLFAATEQAGLQLDGVFVDNFISATLVDLCADLNALPDLPLTYDPNTYRPGVHVAVAGWAYLARLRALLDQQPPPYRAVAVNFWGLGVPHLLSPWIDAWGSEGRSDRSGGNWDPEVLDYRRAVALGRWRGFANQAPGLSEQTVEAFVHRALFYGIWAQRGPQATDWPPAAEDWLAWEHTLVRPLLALGWQPIPYAETDASQVWVERFGDRAFTVYNAGEQPASFTLRIHLASLGLDPQGLTVTEAVSATPVDFTVTPEGDLLLQGHLDPGRTAVYWLEQP